MLVPVPVLAVVTSTRGMCKARLCTSTSTLATLASAAICAALMVPFDAAAQTTLETVGTSARPEEQNATAQGDSAPGHEEPIAPGDVSQEPGPTPTIPPEQGTGDIVVTGSRAITNGARAPTPVTVLTAGNLRAAAPNTLAEGLNQLPQFAGSLKSEGATLSRLTVGNGQNILALRGLGPQRTLVLLDGRRFAPANSIGTVDINTFPSQLIQRVDVVTGGASAAYGSDAVAGVANFILDTKFRGLKGEASLGISTRGDYENSKVGLAYGTGFAEEHGRIVASIDAYALGNPWKNFADDRDWARPIGNFINNPVAGQFPLRIRSRDTRASNSSYGGLITTAGPLRGIQFGPGGTIQQHDYGSFTGTAFQEGGNETAVVDEQGVGAYQKPLVTAFVHGEFDVSPKFTVFAEATHTYQKVGYYQFYQYHNATAGNPITIFQDNAFLPQSVRSIMTANNLASFSMGRYDDDGGPGLSITSKQRLTSLTLGFRGSVAGIDYNGYYSRGRTKFEVSGPGYIEQRYYAAIDSVIDPTTNQPVCRSTLLLGLNPGCVPFNPFGNGSPSAEAIDYVTERGFRTDRYAQDVAGLEGRTSLFSLWSDPVSIAAGGEWRKESLVRTSDPISTSVINFAGVRGGPAGEANRTGGFQTGNDLPFSGSYRVIEGFVEANIPIVKKAPFLDALDLNLAGRVTHYSTSGTVATWKIGATYQPIPDIRLRATQSVDIRAPNLSELYGAGNAGGGVAGNVHPITRIPLTFIGNTLVGNPDLVPERARTLTAGIVFQPEALPGFNASLDFYRIKISKVLGVTERQQTIDQCLLQQIPSACSQILSIDGSVVRWAQKYQNLARAETSGFDFEAGYSFDLAGGRLTARLIVNRLNKLSTTNPGAAPIDAAGGYSRPTWRGNLQLSYASGGWDVFAQTRYLGPGKLNVTWNEGVDIDDNSVSDVVYLDLTVNRTLTKAVRAFVSVTNLLDKAPPWSPVNNAILTAADTSYYDQIGRRVVAGIRFNFR